MPFTFSHPAIILPLKKLPSKYISMTALAAGSITPDFEYFIRMKSRYSHTIDGVLWFNLPLALFILFIFHNLIKENLIDNLPSFIKGRLSELRNFKWNPYFREKWGVVLISIIIGILSHLFWDGFTHRTGHFVRRFSQLEASYILWGIKMPIYRWLQHTSTIIGGLIILRFFKKLPVDKEYAAQKINYKYWAALILTSALVMYCRFPSKGDYKVLWNVVVGGISAVIAGLVLVSAVFKLKKKK